MIETVTIKDASDAPQPIGADGVLQLVDAPDSLAAGRPAIFNSLI